MPWAISDYFLHLRGQARNRLCEFHNADYLIIGVAAVHSISKCDMPIKTKASPWRFLDVAVLFAAHPS
ncbi:hypothetical protein, partial [Sinorhizobium meliloti]|uniref:hypothetical protein n=1 Tax=Rhizobium meliloti TaxID=382 RepID=UPI001AECC3D6